MCQGYYNHAEGYTPEWRGFEDFEGQVVHPQTWPEDLDYANKEVLVIGSGATAATLIPAMADECKHMTMLQRSPTYFAAGRNVNETAEHLRMLEIPETWIHEIVRREILYNQAEFMRRAQEEPEAVKQELFAGLAEYIPQEVIDEHFTPAYRPWQQRLAFVPDADLFKAVTAGKVDVVTDTIERFDATGVITEGGQHIDADIVVTATGFNLLVLGGIEFDIDGQPVDFADTVTYRGMMFTGVPNMAWVFGYFRASWTLRADLMGHFVCRLLKHMDATGSRSVTVELSPEEAALPKLDWIDADNFNPNYLRRSMDIMPKRLDRPEWQHTQNYWLEKDDIPAIDLEDPVFHYRGGEAGGEVVRAESAG